MKQLSVKQVKELQAQANEGNQEAIDKLAEWQKEQEEKAAKKKAKLDKKKDGLRREKMSNPPSNYINLEDQTLGTAVEKLSKDLKEHVKTLSIDDIRYLVDSFYQIQNNRIRSSNQVRSSDEIGEPNNVLTWIKDNNVLLENNIKKILDIYTDHAPVGRWLKSITGIGPVLAAGLLAHLDVTKSPTAGGFWRFAGIDPTLTWEKGQKRPWNADLKLLMWKIADSFVKQSSRESDVYGKIYLARKEYEHNKNNAGEYAERAKLALANKKYVRETITKTTYESGKITDGHIDASAKRYVEKIFLSHVHHVMYLHHYKKDPPAPFAIAILNHAHMIQVPNLMEHYQDLMEN